MAYVQPNSIIQFFKGINLDNRYLHTIYFANESAQNTWFTSKVTSALTFSNMMYRRYTSNTVKIEADATTFLGVTYMRFKNTRTANKWFYAFVLSADYVNENTTVVTYEIDVMQTWFIQNGSVRPCMVLREHVNDDTFGLNLEVEPIGSDVYDSDIIYYFGMNELDNPFEDYSVIMQTTGESSQDKHMIQGLFSGCKYIVNPANTQSDGNTIHGLGQSMLGSWNLQEQEEDIIDLYTIPSFCAQERDGVYDVFGHLGTNNKITIPSSYDNYTPKNKKLFMFPFSYLSLTTHMGDVAIYRWEYFEGTTGASCQFEVDGTLLGGGEIRCYPRAYNGQDHNVDSGVKMANFPKNTANYDAYQAWIASGGTTRLDNERMVNSIKGASGIMSSFASLLGATHPTVSTVDTSESTQFAGYVGNTPIGSVAQRDYQSIGQRSTSVGGITGAVSGLMGTGANMLEAKNKIQYTFNDATYQPNIVVGKPTSSLPVATRDANLYFYHIHIRDDEAKRVDDFFSCFGYAVNKVKAPNLTGRTYWNFVQTQNAVIAGDMPSSSKEAIGRIFDGGITFWHNGDQVGNYRQSVTNGSINNPIVP